MIPTVLFSLLGLDGGYALANGLGGRNLLDRLRALTARRSVNV